MLELLENFSRFLCRFRHPVSLPEDVAQDLGIAIPNNIHFEDFLKRLAAPHNRPKHLWREMSRYLAENSFKSALKKEIFRNSSFFSYYFSKGWVVIALHFDENDLLRRLYVQCPHAEALEGFDIELEVHKISLTPLQALAKEV